VSKVGNANRYARIRKEREAARDAAIKNLIEAKGAKHISGFSDYLISPDGKVFSSANRRVLELSPGSKKSGYRFVGLHKNQQVSYKHVHRLVAEAFIPNPENLLEVNHKNGNKADNNASNLEWTTRSANAQHAMDNGLNPQKGLTHYAAKLNAEQVKEIREAPGRYRDIGKAYGVCAQTICNVKRRSAYADI
jgi:hypothetical protein